MLKYVKPHIIIKYILILKIYLKNIVTTNNSKPLLTSKVRLSAYFSCDLPTVSPH